MLERPARFDLLDRLDRLAREGDIDALGRLILERRRCGEDDALRALAWRLIVEEGAPVQYMVDGPPQTCPTHMLLNWMSSQSKQGPPRLVRPFEVPLLWDPCRARLFAADCAEHVISHLGGDHFGLSELRAALRAAREYAYRADNTDWMSQQRARAEAVSARIADRSRGPFRRHFYLIAQSVIHSCDAIWTEWGISGSVWKAAACAKDAAKQACDTTDPGAEERWQSRRLLEYFLGRGNVGYKVRRPVGIDMRLKNGELGDLRALGVGWDGYKAAPPSDLALRNSQTALDILSSWGAKPSRIVPDASGGVCLMFFPLGEGNPSASLALDNDGSIVLLLIDQDDDAKIEEVEGLKGLEAATDRALTWVQEGQGLDRMRKNPEKPGKTC